MISKRLAAVSLAAYLGGAALAVQEPAPVHLCDAANEPCENHEAASPMLADLPPPQPGCSIYLAPSTIPGGGLGTFVGRNAFKANQQVASGDIILPLFGIGWHSPNSSRAYNLMWSDYSWEPGSIFGIEDDVDEDMDFEMFMVASPGLGSTPNCIQPLNNFKHKTDISVDNAGLLSDGSSPGVGAFTPFYNRIFHAKQAIPPGGELFADYGYSYFNARTSRMGYLPSGMHYRYANRLVKAYVKLKERHNSSGVIHATWDLIHELKSTWKTSRVLNALTDNPQEAEKLMPFRGGLEKQHYNRSRHSLDWLEANGQCMDNLKSEVSTVPHAGRGAFATRTIKAGGLVAPMPLVHIPDRSVFNMYNASSLDSAKQDEKGHVQIGRNISEMVHQQLMLNYCFGHHESTLLLCPYGMMTSLVNHAPSKDRINAKIQWSKRMRKPEWLDQPVWKWGRSTGAGLLVDLVATRNITQGEEIFIDYGDRWQNAWDAHVANFAPRRPGYRSAQEMNEVYTHEPVRTLHERPYYHEVYIRIKCHYRYLEWHSVRDPYNTNRCRVLKRWRDAKSGEYRYLAEAYFVEDDEEAGMNRIHFQGLLFDIPRSAFIFFDLPFGRDHHQTWSFRSEIYFPDEIFPEIWKNKRLENDAPWLVHT